MTARKKKGLGLIIGGSVFILAGIVMFATKTTPPALDIVIAGIGWLGNTLGLVLVLPLDTA